MGQRRNPIGASGGARQPNDMRGAVARRVSAVSAFATGAFAAKKRDNSTTKFEEVEMHSQTSSEDDESTTHYNQMQSHQEEGLLKEPLPDDEA